jgi:hypothetical protein
VPTTFNTPKQWRSRAKEARLLAKQMRDPKSKHALVRVAESYEKIAKRVAVKIVSQEPPVTALRSRYVVLLRRELTRALARLKRAEHKCDKLAAENDRLKARLARPQTRGSRIGSRRSRRPAKQLR